VNESFDLLAAEHEDQVIGPRIEALIREAIEPVLRHVKPADIVDRAVDSWTEDLINEVTSAFTESLLGGSLAEAFVHANDEHHLAMLLRMRARQFVGNRRHRGELERLVERSVELLEGKADRFVSAGIGPLRRWTTPGRSIEPFGGGDDALRDLARRLEVPPSMRTLRRNTTIGSRVVTTADLERLLVSALNVANGALDRSQLRVVLIERLSLHPVATISISHQADERPSLETILGRDPIELTEAEAQVIADDVRGLLSVRQMVILGLRFGRNLSRAQAARVLDCSHGTIDNELGRIGRVILDACEDDHSLARQVLGLVVGRLGDGTGEPFP